MSSATTALRVARWLVTRGRRDDAVSLLCAWAVRSASDANGAKAQMLAAEAARMMPESDLLQDAIVAMQSSSRLVESESLQDAIRRWSDAEVASLEKSMTVKPPVRAQVGFNSNLRHAGHVFHVQTEDSGLERPHVITHLFADGGRIVVSHKRSYAEDVHLEDVTTRVRLLMKAQHAEMQALLRAGAFDDVVAGRAAGGMRVLVDPPRGQALSLPVTRAPEAACVLPPRCRFVTLRYASNKRSESPRDLHHASKRPLRPGQTVMTPMPDILQDALERGAPEAWSSLGVELRVVQHGRVRIRAIDPTGACDVWVRIRTAVEIEPDDEFLVGDQVLVLQLNPPANNHPGPGGTYFFSSPVYPSAFRVAQRLSTGHWGLCARARGRVLCIGASRGDLLIPGDARVHSLHCTIEERGGAFSLSDLGSETGVFVRLRGSIDLRPADELVVGQRWMMFEADA